MSNEHQTTAPTPPDELVQQWRQQWSCAKFDQPPGLHRYIADYASQWGWEQHGAANEAELQQRSDQELEACCEWLVQEGYIDAPCRLRTARRPKPPSLKDQALEAAQRFYAKGHESCTDEEVKDDFDAICRALWRLEELEAPND